MNPIAKNILAVVAGVVLGSVINMGIIMLSSSVIPLPEGVDPTDTESLKAGMQLFEAKHFIFPFLAHALGTLAGAYAAARIAVNNKMYFAMGIGLFFLIGGIVSSFSISPPAWYIAVDLIAAYIPMAWIGWRLASK